MAAAASAGDRVLELLSTGPARLDDDAGWEMGSTNKNGVTYLTKSGKPGFEDTKGIKLRALLPPLVEAEWRKAASKRFKERAKAAAKAAKAAKGKAGSSDPDPVAADLTPPSLMQGLVFLMWDDPSMEVFTRDPMVESMAPLERLGGLVPRDGEGGTLDAAVCIEKDSLPWPMANREFVSLYALHESDDGGQVFMLSVPTEHDLAPPPANDKVVRGQAEMVTRLKLLEDGRVAADMEVWYDMGGSVPKALMNSFISMFANYPMDLRAAVGELGVTKAAAEAAAGERHARVTRVTPAAAGATEATEPTGAAGAAGAAATTVAAPAGGGAGAGSAAAPAPAESTAPETAATAADAPAGVASPEAVLVGGVAPV